MKIKTGDKLEIFKVPEVFSTLMGSVGDITEVERVIISKIDKPRMQLFVLSKDKTFACTQRISFDSEIDFNMYFIKVGKIRKQQLKTRL